MTEDQQITLAATLAAHESVIVILLAEMLSRISPEEAVASAFAADLERPANIQLPEGIAGDDLDDADALAGMAIAYSDAIRRVLASARAKASGRAGP